MQHQSHEALAGRTMPRLALAVAGLLGLLVPTAAVRAEEPYSAEPETAPAATAVATSAAAAAAAPSAAPSSAATASGPSAQGTASGRADKAIAAKPAPGAPATTPSDEGEDGERQEAAPSGPPPILWIGGTCLGLAVAAGGAGTGLLLSANATDNATTGRGAIVAYAASGAALVAGVVLVIVGATSSDEPAAQEPAGPEAAPKLALTPSFGGLMLGGLF